MPDGFIHLKDRIERDPNDLALLPDPALLCLARALDGSALDPVTHGNILGEIIFRRLLYIDCPTAISSAVDTQASASLKEWLTPFLKRSTLPERLPDCGRQDNVPVLENVEKGALDWVCKRSRNARNADGFVFLVNREETPEGVPVPFRLLERERDQARFRDVVGRPIESWRCFESVLDSFSHHGWGMQVLCALSPETAGKIEGNSFLLALLVAIARREVRLPEFPPLSLGATGGFSIFDSGSELTTVNGLIAKYGLARKIGVKLFVCPQSSEFPASDDVLPIPPGSSVEQVLSCIRERLQTSGLAGMTPAEALNGVRKLDSDIHLGVVGLEMAASRLDRYEEVFRERLDDEMAQEGLVRVRLARIAIANHSGRAGEAKRLAAEINRKDVPISLLVDHLARHVVTLTDAGELEEARGWGEFLLQKLSDAKKEFTVGDRKQFEMIAHGVLGGQPLLQLALIEPESWEKISLDHLNQALECARHCPVDDGLKKGAEIARDLVQRVLWFALLRPDETDRQVELVEKEMESLPPAACAKSIEYLRRMRFLGAYRLWLRDGSIAKGFPEWPLPEHGAGHASWLRATALKYRGALYGAGGEIAKAEADFEQAWKCLDQTNSPLLRFIGGTVALQAGDSLGRNSRASRNYLELALTVFDRFRDWGHPKWCGELWYERAEGLLNGASVDALPNPQLFYVY